MSRFFVMLALFIAFSAFSEELPVPAATYYPTLSSVVRPDPIVRGDTAAGHRLNRAHAADSEASYPTSYEPLMHKNIDALPTPQAMPTTARHLSLREAIALALRDNPNIEIAESQRIIDKFNLELALQSYRTQWSPVTLASTIQNKALPTWTAGAGFTVPSTIGTSFALTQTNNLLGGFGNTKLTLTQPVLKGFGYALNRITYQNGIDNEKSARLGFKGSVIGAVVAVINAYYNLVGQYNALGTSNQSLVSQEKQAKNTALQVKVGQMAPSDLVQQQANIETVRLSVVQQENAVRNAYFSFLTSLGLPPSANIVIDQKIMLSDTRIPSLRRCIALALQHNITYRQALLALNVTKRALISAKDARKWTLNLSTGVTLGSQRTAVGSPILSTDTNPTLGLSLSVPIDNISTKAAVVQAKVNIQNAQLQLEQQKETLVSNVMNQVEAIKNQYQQIHISEKNVQLQQQTLDNAKLKFKYGQASIFETNQLENNLLSAQVGLIGEKITYLNNVTTLYSTLGLTLNKWGITLRY